MSQDFQRIDHLDLLGNARSSGERRRQEGGNVFDDQIRTGIGITVAVRKNGRAPNIRYHVVPPYTRAGAKRTFLKQLGSASRVPWRTLAPNTSYTWLVPENADEYAVFTPIQDFFDLHTVGVKTNRDDVVYDWNRERLAARIKKFIDTYNAEVYHHKANPGADWPTELKWSRDLKQDALRGNRLAEFEERKVLKSLYRPFTKKWLFFDRILNEEVYQWPSISGRSICVTAHTQVPFSAQITDTIPNEAPGGRQGQCFPLSHLKDSAAAQFRQHYSDPDHHQRRRLPLHLRAPASPRLPRALRPQLEARTPPHSPRAGLLILRPGRQGIGAPTRRIRIAGAVAP